MASVYKVQVSLASVANMPEDQTVNTWCCTTTATGDLTALADFMTALESFYTSVDSQLSSDLSGAAVVKAYDLSDPEPRIPVLTDTWTLAVATTALPNEVALCVSFQGVPASGVNQARRRGRIFLGPLYGGCVTSTGDPDSTLMSTVVAAADALVTASKADPDWAWAVYSEVNNTAVNVDNGWVDNAWDTQRRRGVKASTRTLFS